jgi:hypothetical protein
MTTDKVLPRTPAQMQEAFVANAGLKNSEVRTLTRRCHRALEHRHNPPGREWEWHYLEELDVDDRRLDGWAIKKYSFERRAFEIKVTRADFLSEVRTPEKRTPAFGVSNRFFFVAPAGLIEPHEVPADCGLIEVRLSVKSFARDQTRTVVEAPWREIADPSLSFLCEVARRAA